MGRTRPMAIVKLGVTTTETEAGTRNPEPYGTANGSDSGSFLPRPATEKGEHSEKDSRPPVLLPYSFLDGAIIQPFALPAIQRMSGAQR